MTREAIAKIILFNEKNEILMLRIGEHTKKPEKSYQPDLPGGIVDPNESEHAAVVRETQEEAGITLDPNIVTLGYAATQLYADESKSVTRLLYVARLDHTPDVTISWEHGSYEWCDATKFLATYEYSPFFKKAIGYLLNNQLV